MRGLRVGVRNGGGHRPRSGVSAISKLAFAVGAVLMLAATQREGVLGPAEEQVIRYEDNADLTDPVTRFQKRLAKGELKLEYEADRGYLKSLLKELGVPISSQTLVFSKTSSQASHTSPKTPRALYFNDRVFIGWVQGGPEIDVVAFDPKKGPIFFTLKQKKTAVPKFERRNECVTMCHFGPKTVNVPGLFIRSAHTLADGNAVNEILDFVPGHNSPLPLRWGGWYVTGRHYKDRHLGNTFMKERHRPEDYDSTGGSNVTSLKPFFDTSKYLSPHSDTVALLVLDHAVRMHNLITQANYETRLSLGVPGTAPSEAKERIARAGDALLSYMLFLDEAPLEGRVEGTAPFTKEFPKLGPMDSKGRSLRDFDLKKRVFRYPCSYLIYTEAFDALPKPMKTYLFRRLEEILTGKDKSEYFGRMPKADREAVREILLETKPEYRQFVAGVR